MKEIFIATGTVTKANIAKEILMQKGIRAEAKRHNDRSGKYGCGYGVSFKGEDAETARNLLSEKGIRIIDVIVLEK